MLLINFTKRQFVDLSAFGHFSPGSFHYADFNQQYVPIVFFYLLSERGEVDNLPYMVRTVYGRDEAKAKAKLDPDDVITDNYVISKTSTALGVTSRMCGAWIGDKVANITSPHHNTYMTTARKLKLMTSMISGLSPSIKEGPPIAEQATMHAYAKAFYQDITATVHANLTRFELTRTSQSNYPATFEQLLRSRLELEVESRDGYARSGTPLQFYDFEAIRSLRNRSETSPLDFRWMTLGELSWYMHRLVRSRNDLALLKKWLRRQTLTDMQREFVKNSRVHVAENHPRLCVPFESITRATFQTVSADGVVSCTDGMLLLPPTLDCDSMTKLSTMLQELQIGLYNGYSTTELAERISARVLAGFKTNQPTDTIPKRTRRIRNKPTSVSSNPAPGDS